MRQKVFVQRIETKEDMSRLEHTIGALLGGEHNKCSLIRCNEFIQLRLCALYGKGAKPMHVYGEGLQISLDRENVAVVYLLTSYVEPDEGLLGKRSEPEDDTPVAPPKPADGDSDCAEADEPACIKDGDE